MTELVALLTTHLFVFTLVLSRVGGLVTVAPLFSSVAVPVNLRVVLALAMAVLLTPGLTQTDLPVPQSFITWGLAIGAEAALGLALGLGTTILLAGAQLAGQLIAQMSGLSLAEIFDPDLGGEIPLFSQLLGMFTVAVYLLLGGHRWLLAGLLDSFETFPLDHGALPGDVPQVLASLLGESFSLGLRVAAPAILALLLATIILGLLSRTMTQLHVMSLGFGINALVAFGALAFSLGSAAWLLEDPLQTAATQLLDAVASTSTTPTSN